MSLLTDLANGKEINFAGGKLTITYKADANVMSISIGGNAVDFLPDDVSKLMQIEGILKALKNLEAKV
jgi:hypothetical protein